MEMTVRQIIIKTHRYNIVGVITKSENGVITIKEFSGPESKVDITTSPTLKKNVGTIFSTAKLSEFKEGSIVSVIAYTDPQSSNLSALKAVILNL
ncbi:hypothetical protein HY310_00485 [Candidatus Microgenomates bacterium]|nr:hypothetical protein [Candidatus Microgenomates bacterium]